MPIATVGVPTLAVELAVPMPERRRWDRGVQRIENCFGGRIDHRRHVSAPHGRAVEHEEANHPVATTSARAGPVLDRRTAAGAKP
jgi:hypothetical protein